MKTLIVVSHPTIQDSEVNQFLMNEAQKHPEKYTIHHLEQVYPDGQFDIEKEQALVEAHDGLVLQFPIYWFNCPPMMKKWLDEVFTYGWAYGSKGKKLTDRKIGLAISAGAGAEKYAHDGAYHVTIEEVLVPFKATFDLVGANDQGFVDYYGAESGVSDNDLATYLPRYLEFLEKF